jgi:hypothetical protein
LNLGSTEDLRKLASSNAGEKLSRWRRPHMFV